MFGRSDRKLSLKKETLRALTESQLRTVVGGEVNVSRTCCACTHHCVPKFTDACPTFHNCPVPATNGCPGTIMTIVL